MKPVHESLIKISKSNETIRLVSKVHNVQNKKIIKLKYLDLWWGFPSFRYDAIVYLMLVQSGKYEVILTDEPDYLFYSVYPRKLKHHMYEQKYNPIKIEYLAENFLPNFTECDYAITLQSMHKEDRHFYLPFFFTRNEVYSLPKNRDFKVRTKFCGTVISNDRGKFRNNFFKILNKKYKKVDSGGTWKNNVGGRVEDKIKFLSDYKFSMCFENSQSIGYLTEKIMDSFAAGTIPIYWGDPEVDVIFNTKAFVWVRDENDVDRAIEQIKEIDNNEELYRNMLKEPVFNDKDYVNKTLKEFEEYLYHIFDQDKDKARRFERKK